MLYSKRIDFGLNRFGFHLSTVIILTLRPCRAVPRLVTVLDVCVAVPVPPPQQYKIAAVENLRCFFYKTVIIGLSLFKKDNFGILDINILKNEKSRLIDNQ